MKDYAEKKFCRASFVNEDLSYANFAGSDIRGADFTGANLSGVDFSNAKMGIPSAEKFLIFIGALIISVMSGYIAMLAGETVQQMLASEDNKVKFSGIIAVVSILAFIILAVWKGGRDAIRHFGIPVVVLSVTMAIIGYMSGVGTGEGMLYLALSFLFVIIMFIVGTIARAAAGTISNILFIVVALSGGMFGKSVGGGIGTVVMALACMQISKRALNGAKGFEWLRKVSSKLTARFGTSFRNSRLANARFSGNKIHNTDFSGADTSFVHWGDSKKVNCITENDIRKMKE
jgi:hypothetical protein